MFELRIQWQCPWMLVQLEPILVQHSKTNSEMSPFLKLNTLDEGLKVGKPVSFSLEVVW